MKKILVTDTLFIYPENEAKLREAGFEVERLPKPDATEEELIEAVKGKTGYILGGIEKVTDKVFESADELKAIVFTGIGYKIYIPGFETAIKKNILVANTPDGPTNPVAEWSVAAALAMNRGLFDLAGPDGQTFLTTPGLQNLNMGIIALGRIGGRIAEMLQPFRPAEIYYYSTHRHEDKEKSLRLKYLELKELLNKSDVVFLCVPEEEVGAEYFSKDLIDQMKQDALLVSFHNKSIFDNDALFEAVRSDRIRVTSDHPLDERFFGFPKSKCYFFKASNAFNTDAALRVTSDMATDSMLNMLTKGSDKFAVNQ